MIRDVVDAMVALSLLILLLLSAANQVDRGRLIRAVRRHDTIGLIPTWTFFAPSPGRTDYHVLYRDFTVDERSSPWRAAPMAPSKSALRWAWNPDKRIRKGLIDHISYLLRSLPSAEMDPSSVVFHPSYLVLLNWISGFPRDPRSTRRQFLIVQTAGFGPKRTTPAPIFVSYAHELDEQPLKEELTNMR